MTDTAHPSAARRLASAVAVVLGMLGIVAAALLFVFATDADAPTGIKDGTSGVGEEPSAPRAQEGVPPECAFEPARFGDLDGDGVRDRVVVGTDTRAALGNAVSVVACIGEELVLRYDLPGGTQDDYLLTIADIDGNGDAEVIFVDSPRSSGGFLDVVDGLLVDIVSEAGRPILLPVAVAGESSKDVVATWGCGDLDGDGIGEIVQVSVTFDDAEVNYVLTPLELVDGVVEVGEVVTGTESRPEDVDAFARSLVSACG